VELQYTPLIYKNERWCRMTDKEVEVFLEAKEKLSKIDKNLTLKEYTNNKQLMTVYCDKCK
jgi:hypothetical protein